MRRARAPTPWPSSPRLATRGEADRRELWTETAAAPPPVYGERWRSVDGRSFRSFEPVRSKLSAGIVRGWDGPLPRPGERWLYLGAATGTTASHVVDLVGPAGAVYAVERSVRPFARLLALAERWEGLLPILSDARDPEAYDALVPPIDGVYADVAQPDQVAIVERNAAHYLRGPGDAVLVALKTASMGRGRTGPEHLKDAEQRLGHGLDLERSVRLDPFHRGHYLVGGPARRALFAAAPTPDAPRPPARLRVRRRP